MKKQSKSSSVEKQNPPLKLVKIPKGVTNQVQPFVQELLSKCTDTKVLSKRAEWNEMEEIFNILEKVRALEKDYVYQFPDRKAHIENFLNWCISNGAEFSSVMVQEVSEGNYGVVAKNKLMEDEPFLTVPRKITMSEDTAKLSRLGKLISKDTILMFMPNIKLAMHLLSETLDPDSFWRPYISILPSSYSTILYFSLEELKLLQKSPVLEGAFKIIRSVIRQYCYFFNLFQNDPGTKSLKLGQYFTYDLYRWAVSTTMTRQNLLPSTDGEQKVMSFVPLFDMCNHANGKLTTDFSLEKDVLLSYPLKEYSKDEEVFIFYGARTNAEILLHNGFVYLDNENDALEIKLGISKNDPSYNQKLELCNKFNIPSNGPFYLRCKLPIDKELLQFLEINVMKSDELESILKSGEIGEEISSKFPDLINRAYTYLKDRVNLLLMSYGSTLEDDEELLKHCNEESHHSHLALQMRTSEKRILSRTYNYCLKMLQ